MAVSFAYFFEFADINSFATTVPKLIKLWGVTVNQVAYVTSASFVGMFFGSLIASWMADRWGRKNALVITTLWYAVVLPRGGLFLGHRVPGRLPDPDLGRPLRDDRCGRHLRQRAVPAAKRGKYQAYAIVIGICGTPATNLIASLVVPLADWTWRLVYVWGALGILFILFTKRLKESPRWYENKGDYAKADAILKEIEATVSAEKGALPEPASTR